MKDPVHIFIGAPYTMPGEFPAWLACGLMTSQHGRHVFIPSNPDTLYCPSIYTWGPFRRYEYLDLFITLSYKEFVFAIYMHVGLLYTSS